MAKSRSVGKHFDPMWWLVGKSLGFIRNSHWMITEVTKKRVAIMIDGENLPASVLPKIERVAMALGDIQVRRVYGNFASGAHSEWIVHAQNHPLDVRQVTPSKHGKNATDITLAVEAVEIMLRKGFECLCIASGDRDFQPLVSFIRSEGREVHGFGSDAADQKLRNSCTKYHVVLVASKSSANSSKVGTKVKATPTKPEEARNLPRTDDAHWSKVREALSAIAKQREWVPLPELATVLGQAKLQPATFGSKSWLQVFKKDSRFVVEKIAGSTQSQIRIAA
jgi:uncharacterized protein (TIGR00288 family)